MSRSKCETSNKLVAVQVDNDIVVIVGLPSYYFPVETREFVVDDDVAPLEVLVELHHEDTVLLQEMEHGRVDALTHLHHELILRYIFLLRIIRADNVRVLLRDDTQRADKPAITEKATLLHIIRTRAA